MKYLHSVRHWYKIRTLYGHVGAGRSLDANIYIWAENVIEVLDKYRVVGGVKRSKTPSITALTQQESIEFEKRILEEKRSLKNAKRRCYKTRSEYRSVQ